MNRMLWVLGLTGLLGISILVMVGCERAIQGTDSNTYTDNTRFFGTYTGQLNGGSATVNGTEAAGSGAGAFTVEIGSDATKKNQIRNMYFYIPQVASEETFDVTDLSSFGGVPYTEQVAIHGSTISFNVALTNGDQTYNVVFDFSSGYNDFGWQENDSLVGSQYIWTGHFVRTGTNTPTH